MKALLVLLAGLAVLAGLSIFTVDERQVAILLQFGKVERTDMEPGLHFKVPVVQNVLKFDSRIQTLDSDPQNYLTFEKKNVIVDSFVKWRIADVRRFYTSAGGSILQANNRLGEVIIKRLRDEFGKRTIQQVVSGERTEIMDKLRVAAKDQADELGLEIVDVRIKRVDLPQDVSQSVFNRMRAERQEVAKLFRSEGEEEARELRAGANKDREVILAEAERRAQIIRGAGDARATEIYAAAFGQDREFYKLYRSLNAYRTAFGSTADILLLEPTSEFFDYFQGSGPRP
ncbi:MAG: protease modulator HflC [Thiotrichales bacterium]|nr:protease modulator HflC [Thiotrichales bacterium]MCY4286166.1 protease modulator HflC [Thiotrichales bacterium]MCY4349936.1 protease modulator HflC [Thiotrichales bacterium]